MIKVILSEEHGVNATTETWSSGEVGAAGRYFLKLTFIRRQ